MQQMIQHEQQQRQAAGYDMTHPHQRHPGQTHHRPAEYPHMSPQVEEELTGHQKYLVMAFQYATKFIDYSTVALRWGWMPFVVFVGSSSVYCGPSINPLEIIGLKPSSQQQQQQYGGMR